MLELNKRLSQITEKKRIQQKLLSEQSFLEQDLAKEELRYTQLETTLSKEGKDVEKLEGFNISALFYTILGSRDEQLEKERQEYLAAKLKFDQCKDAVITLKKELVIVKKRIDQLGDVNKDYSALIREKESYLKDKEDSFSQRLLELDESITNNLIRSKELKEALEAGSAVLKEIESVTDALSSAEGWGTWDLLGGGLISTAIKHSRIDDAKKATHRVQQRLRSFVKELKDVNPNIETEVKIDIGGFLTFADFFFDGLIADWVVLSKIKDSLAATVSLRKKIEDIVQYLKGELAGSHKELAKLKEEREVLVIEV